MEACPAGGPAGHRPPGRVPPHGQEVQTLDNRKHRQHLFKPCLSEVELHPAVWEMSHFSLPLYPLELSKWPLRLEPMREVSKDTYL